MKVLFVGDNRACVISYFQVLLKSVAASAASYSTYRPATPDTLEH
jgi:hypothetical protein